MRRDGCRTVEESSRRPAGAPGPTASTPGPSASGRELSMSVRERWILQFLAEGRQAATHHQNRELPRPVDYTYRPWELKTGSWLNTRARNWRIARTIVQLLSHLHRRRAADRSCSPNGMGLRLFPGSSVLSSRARDRPVRPTSAAVTLMQYSSATLRRHAQTPEFTRCYPAGHIPHSGSRMVAAGSTDRPMAFQRSITSRSKCRLRIS